MWFLILLVLGVQQSREFDQRKSRKFNCGNVNKTLVIVKSRNFFIKRINEAKGYNWRRGINSEGLSNMLMKDIYSREGLESMYKIFDIVFLMSSTIYSYYI